MVLQRPRALRERMPSDLKGVQTKGYNKVFLMVKLNSEREPCEFTPQELPHLQYSRDPSVPGDSPGQSQATVHRSEEAKQAGSS